MLLRSRGLSYPATRRLVVPPCGLLRSLPTPRPAARRTISSAASVMAKRKALAESSGQDSSKRTKLQTEEYPDWPAPRAQIRAARNFVEECVKGGHDVLVVPDKDADGMSSGKIMYHTLTSMGHPTSKIQTYLLPKAASVFDGSVSEHMGSLGCSRIIVLDQGSRGGPPIVASPDIEVLILDHHESSAFPERAVVATACRSPPIATAAMLTWAVCAGMSEEVRTKWAWVAVCGVFGDLSSDVKFGEGPWPAVLADVVKQETKKALTDAVAMINAPQRAAEYNVYDAWEAVLKAQTPRDLSKDPILLEARSRVNKEVERCTHTPPKFSRDGRVALLRINSGYRVHPQIATRWSAHLKSSKLVLVMVANDGYHPSGEHTNFSCRIVNSLRKLPEGEQPNLMEILLEFGGRVEDEGFMERVGGNFAKGHKQASGGIILSTDFELFCQAMEIGVPADKSDKSPGKKKVKELAPGQTTLAAFFTPKKDPSSGGKTEPKQEADGSGGAA